MPNVEELKNLLSRQLERANFTVAENTQERLIEYLLLLDKWNHAYNLTSVRDIKQMIVQHILDSLSITEFVQGKNILDVGTGAGLPGIPLALTQPKREFVLLDSNGKKTRFLTHVAQALKIENVRVEQARVEEFKPEFCFGTIVSRAFSSLKNFLDSTQHLCCANGVFLAMKGSYPTEELAEVKNSFNITAVHALKVPQLDAQRHLVVISRQNY